MKISKKENKKQKIYNGTIPLRIAGYMLNRPDKNLFNDITSGNIAPEYFLRQGLIELRNILEEIKKNKTLDFSGAESRYKRGFELIQANNSVDQKIMLEHSLIYESILEEYGGLLRKTSSNKDKDNPLPIKLEDFSKYENETPEQERKRRREIEERSGGFNEGYRKGELSPMEEKVLGIDKYGIPVLR